MKLRTVGLLLLPAACLLGISLSRVTPVHGASAVAAAVASEPGALPSSASWNRVAAANYLDGREVWWQSWPGSQRDHGTICISCHTVVPYAMSRSALRRDLEEPGVAAPEKILLENVEMRVNRWSEMVPFYSDAKNGPGKTAQSHSTEAVMNAVVLASYDRREGSLRPVTQKALHEAWVLQEQSGENAGGWLWQDFHLAPFESAESAYQGAAMLMLEAGTAPKIFARDPENRVHLDLLKHYLRQHYAAQPLLNQVYVYWASANAHGLLDKGQRKQLLKTIQSLQQPDGGWLIASLEQRERSDKTPQSKDSDGFATALVLLSLEASPGKHQGESIDRGLAWLEQHQEKDGRWRAPSLNKERDPESNVGRFMADAATGYAVLALEEAKSLPGHRGSREVSALTTP